MRFAYISLLLTVCSLAGGCSPILSAGKPQTVHHTLDNTPAEMQNSAEGLNWVIVAATVAVGLGVGLAVWAPLERPTGFAIACGAISTAITACCLRLTIAHPAIMYGLIVLAICGLMYCVYENFWKPKS